MCTCKVLSEAKECESKKRLMKTLDSNVVQGLLAVTEITFNIFHFQLSKYNLKT